MLAYIFVVGFAFSQAPLRDFLIYTSAVTLALYFIVGGWTLFQWIKSERHEIKKLAIADFILFVFGLPVVALFFYSCWVLLRLGYILQIHGPHSAILRPIFTALITLLAGAVLFKFRERARGLYGLTEVVAGVSIAAYRISTGDADLLNASPEVYIALLTAGIYLVVRGLDNMEQGKFRLGLITFGIK